jgi:AI-2E family transporter
MTEARRASLGRPALYTLILVGLYLSYVVLAFGISMIDNVLRPLVLSGRTSINGLVVFLGLLGGTATFGFVGVAIGPIILVTTARLLNNLRHPELLDEAASRPDAVVAVRAVRIVDQRLDFSQRDGALAAVMTFGAYVETEKGMLAALRITKAQMEN